MTSSSKFRVLLLLLASALVLAACSDDDGDSGGDPKKADASASTAPVEAIEGQVPASLAVVVKNVGGKSEGGTGIPLPMGLSCTKSIPATCSGSYECPATEDDSKIAVCVWLATDQAHVALEPGSSEDEMCTQQFGGPEVATVKGTLNGADVDMTFKRSNGCEIARFNAASSLWIGSPPDPTSTPGGVQGAGAPPVGDSPPPLPSDASAPPGPDVIDDPPAAFDQ